jgi:ribonuclease P protein component
LLPREKRIRRGAEIKQILKKKQFHFTSPLLYFAGQNNKNEGRFLVICSKRLGGAVVRNKIRRQITAWYLKNEHKMAKNIDMIVTPRKVSEGSEYAEQITVGLTKLKLCQE